MPGQTAKSARHSDIGGESRLISPADGLLLLAHLAPRNPSGRHPFGTVGSIKRISENANWNFS